MPSPPLPRQHWHIAPAQLAQRQALATATGLHPLLAQVLINRGMQAGDIVEEFRDPSLISLPDPAQDFADLSVAVAVLDEAITRRDTIAICGDYDADGMTSTALLIRALRTLGGCVDYAIPSRMSEGYGLNSRIVEDFAATGVRVVITVDNGIRAHEAVARAKELGLIVIITDHHALPEELPQADAILNPQMIDPLSPYRGMAGVGVAYLLALTLAERRGERETLAAPLLALCTLGTIADMAPLTGINRLWVKQGLSCLTGTTIPGIRALLKACGKLDDSTVLPDSIGFGLGPRINAVGRIGDPQIVIELLTTADPHQAGELAQACESLNQERQQLCRTIKQEIVAELEHSQRDLPQERILTVRGETWHHGVIGLVAGQLLEQYGAPVFIVTADEGHLRGSARGRDPFHVAAALDECADLLLKHGGHAAAGGFSLTVEHWPLLEERLHAYAQRVLTPAQIQPQITIEAEASLAEIDFAFYDQLQTLQPFGIGNPEPLFWSGGVQVSQQQVFGKEKNHLRFHVRSEQGGSLPVTAWGWGSLHPLPNRLDLAYAVNLNTWRGEHSLELMAKGVRLPKPPLQVTYRSAPTIPHALTWHPLSSLAEVLPTWQGTVLLYGYRRPQITPPPGLTIHYDRPQAGCHYDAVVFWSLPPSLTHLAWLLTSTQPQNNGHQVYVHSQVIPLPPSGSLQQQIQYFLSQHDEIDLLRLSQQWWIAPSTLVAGLRSVGHPCLEFPATGSLTQELEKLQRWYVTPVVTLATYCQA